MCMYMNMVFNTEILTQSIWEYVFTVSIRLKEKLNFTIMEKLSVLRIPCTLCIKWRLNYNEIYAITVNWTYGSHGNKETYRQTEMETFYRVTMVEGI